MIENRFKLLVERITRISVLTESDTINASCVLGFLDQLVDLVIGRVPSLTAFAIRPRDELEAVHGDEAVEPVVHFQISILGVRSGHLILARTSTVELACYMVGQVASDWDLDLSPGVFVIVEGTSIGPVAVMLRLGRRGLGNSLRICQRFEDGYRSLAEYSLLIEVRGGRIAFQLAAASWLCSVEDVMALDAIHSVVLRPIICLFAHSIRSVSHAAHARRHDENVEA